MTHPVFAAFSDRDTGVRSGFGRLSRLFRGERRFRHFARFDRNVEEKRQIIRQKMIAYRWLIPASRMILLHFSVSLSMNFPNSGPAK